MAEFTKEEIEYLSPYNGHLALRKTDSRISEKLLYCLLETMKEMKQEIQELRRINQRLDSKIESIITTNNYSQKPAVTVYNTNL